ncbi:MAG: CRISPR-associated endonuclease Cas6 [Acetivibrionales bacterium]
MELEIFMVKLTGNYLQRRDIPKIRGFLANEFSGYTELHNHTTNGSFIYGYPKIQYKVISGIPHIISIGDSAQVLIDVFLRIKEIDLKNRALKLLEKGYYVKKEYFGIIKEMKKYRFITPWMALNQENYRKYIEHDSIRKAEMLKSILTGNILSMSKYLNYDVQEKIVVLLNVRPVNVNFKNNRMFAFKGEFLVNFKIPDLLGIGKSVSRGFGTVKAMPDEEFV